MADYFGPRLKEAVDVGRVPLAEIDDHARRILYADIPSGIVDDPPQKSVVDVEQGFEVAQRIEGKKHCPIEEQTSRASNLPSKTHTIAIIGGHADVGMLSGSGSAQVDPPGGNAIMRRARARRIGRSLSGFLRHL